MWAITVHPAVQTALTSGTIVVVGGLRGRLCEGFLQTVVVAHEQLSCFFITKMKPVAKAIPVYLAGFTQAGSGPAPVAHNGKAVVPYVEEIVGIDVSLYVIGAQTGAG